MSWDTILDELDAFARLLLTDPDTELTGLGLLRARDWFDHTWREGRRLLSSDPIPIPAPRSKGLHPVNCELSGAEVQFEFELGDIAVTQLPHRAQFQVRVMGDVEYPDCIAEVEDHWRVDTHNFEGEPREPHPLFHFQRGGHAQDAWAGDHTFVPGADLPRRADDRYWRGLMQSPGPRVPFPPCCPIIAIDFIIGQHNGFVWGRLHNTPEYRQVIATAQRRLWLPFFENLSTGALRQLWLGAMWMGEVANEAQDEEQAHGPGLGDVAPPDGNSQ